MAAAAGGAASAIVELPGFKDVAPSERPALLTKKLRMCRVRCNFSDAGDEQQRNLDSVQRDTKLSNLLDIVDYINNTKGPFPEAIMPEVMRMVSENIFRPLPQRSRDTPFDPEEDEPMLEPAWQHLHIVYEFFLRFIVSSNTEAKVAKRYTDTSFITRFLELFDSEDPRERDYLKTILHRIYGKFMPHRQFVRKAISNVFYTFVYEQDRHNGIAELLEILGSIINGFALPLKEEHKSFLTKALIPLHKPSCLAQYHQQLAYCMLQYVEKEPKLAETVILGILKYWPKTNSPKEVLVLSEMEELLQQTRPEEFGRIAEPLFEVVGRCMVSPHFQVAERALFLWNEEHIASLVSGSRAVVLPKVYGALQHNTNHWNSTVHGLTFNIQKMFMEMDQRLWADCADRWSVQQERNKSASTQRQRLWAELEAKTALSVVQ